MPEKKEKFYITTSIPYLNAAPHLGHALEFLQADVIARYKRFRGSDVFFLSGTDEHGAKIAKAAKAQKKEPKNFVDDMSKKFAELLSRLGISNDDFIRTTDQKRHWPGAQLIWKKLTEAGDIYKGFYKGLYCEGCEAFITEKDLNENGNCKIHHKKPEVIEEENYLFKLSKYVDRLKEIIVKKEFEIFPEWRKNETLKILDEIGDISFSRPSKDILWGIPVPGDATQTMYVWCDALPNYLTGIGYGTEWTEFSAKGGPAMGRQKYWPADMHIIGKDIMKFHTIFWPAMLMSAGITLPKTIFIHGFINVGGEKMSKTTGNVVDPMLLIEKYGKDAVRFYLAHEVPLFNDGDYTEEHFANIYEGVLVNGLGNLLSRTLKMMSQFGEILKPNEGALTRYPLKKNLEFTIAEGEKIEMEETTPTFLVDNILWQRYKEYMEGYNFVVAIQHVFSFLRRLDEYIEEYKVYKMAKEDPEGAKIILWNIAYSLASAAWMLKPFLPDTSDKILNALGVDPNSETEWTKFSAKDGVHLFPRIK